MRTVLLFILLALLASDATAVNYYFSTLTGDDSRTAQQAQSPSTPWQSIDRLNAMATSLKPGDSVCSGVETPFTGPLLPAPRVLPVMSSTTALTALVRHRLSAALPLSRPGHSIPIRIFIMQRWICPTSA
jgi:hypothetical protein